MCFISVNTHFAHRDSLLVDRRKMVASENLYRVVVGGHTAYWQHLVCTLSLGHRRYPDVFLHLFFWGGEVFFISVTHHIAHRGSLLVDCRKTLWVVASENLYRVVVGGHTAYWQHLVCTLSSGQRRYPEVVCNACRRGAPASRSAKRLWRSKVAAVRPAGHSAVSSSSSVSLSPVGQSRPLGSTPS